MLYEAETLHKYIVISFKDSMFPLVAKPVQIFVKIL